MDHDALDRLIATVETLESRNARAKDDGDAAALAELLKQCEVALERIERLRAH